MRNKLGWLAAVIFSLFLVSPAQAKVVIEEKGPVSVAVSEVINDDLFIGAETVDIAGTINGDVYVGAGTVKFSGRTSGDLVVGAGTVVIDQAVIGDSLIVGAGTVAIDDQSRIGGSLIAGSGTLDNQASVGRNFMIGGGTINLNAPVGGEVRVGGSNLSLGPKTMIGKDLIYAVEEFDQDEAAVIRGEVTRQPMPEFDRRDRSDFWQQAKLGFHLLSFLGALVVGGVMLWLVNKPFQAISDKIQNRFAASLGSGLVLLFVVPPALLLLAFSGIGFPLAAIGGLLFLIDLYLAKIFSALALGRLISRNFGWKSLSSGAVFFVGLTAYYLLRLVPFVGFFVRLVSLVAGLGSLWIYKKQLMVKK